MRGYDMEGSSSSELSFPFERERRLSVRVFQREFDLATDSGSEAYGLCSSSEPAFELLLEWKKAAMLLKTPVEFCLCLGLLRVTTGADADAGKVTLLEDDGGERSRPFNLLFVTVSSLFNENRSFSRTSYCALSSSSLLPCSSICDKGAAVPFG